MEERITFKIGQNVENIREEFFVVPHELETLYLDVHLPEKCRCMGYVILWDEKKSLRLQKLLGYGEQKLAVGADGSHTTIGGVPGKIHAGTWRLQLGIFTEYLAQRLGDVETEILIAVSDKGEITDPMGNQVWVEGENPGLSRFLWEKISNPQTGWYKGDFHTHTRLSDGKETVAHAMEKAEAMELDFYVPTEHNLMHTGWCDTRLCILPGIEITTNLGHCNLFGITEMPERLYDIVVHNGSPELEGDILAVLKEAREKGWIVSINHPFLTIWKWQLSKTPLDAFQCVEIINDPTYQDAPGANEEAVRFLDALWQDGHRIYGIGGSDSHNLLEERYPGADLPSVPGDPATWVYCDGLSPKNLLAHVRQGHMCVTRYCQILPRITLEDREYLPGEEIKGIPGNGEAVLCYQAEILGLSRVPLVFLVKNGQKIPVEVTANQNGNYQIHESVTLHSGEWSWVRLEVRDWDGKLCGYVNPVFCGSRMPKAGCLGELWEQMGENKA